ncbi:hypothetical protein ACUXCC_003406 [Cytobacillus horneckiae]|uniref:DUF4181 domain-containing protein n=1 Tax=Cytobacillus horneckiae TaxID=549687 RepID=A0A2N0ZE23_9BACI|nr:hypothetical protein CWS20_16755 [Cytobacillus horneckiae]
MGIFFQSQTKENIKSLNVLRTLLLLPMVCFLIMWLMNSLSSQHLKYFFILAATISFINLVEGFIQKESKRVLYIEVMLFIIWISLTLTL